MVLDELHIYGSSRHGIHKPGLQLMVKSYQLNRLDSAIDSSQSHLSYQYFKRTLTFKQYELTNHLGNVLATVLDRKTFVGNDTLEYYQADVYTAGLYYAFGSGIEEMQYSSDTSSKYRYGFNNQEKDPELGEYYAFEYRMHDARLGRFLSEDPLSDKMPYYSPYLFAGNKPICAIDANGLIEIIIIKHHTDLDGKTIITKTTVNIKTLEDEKGLTRSTMNVHVYTKDTKTEDASSGYTSYSYNVYQSYNIEANTGETDAERFKRTDPFAYYVWLSLGTFAKNNHLGTGQLILATQDRDPLTGINRDQKDKMFSFLQGIADMATLGVASKVPGKGALTKLLIWNLADMSVEKAISLIPNVFEFDDNQTKVFIYHMTKLIIEKKLGDLKKIQEMVVSIADKGLKGAEAIKELNTVTGFDINQPIDKETAAKKAVEDATGTEIK